MKLKLKTSDFSNLLNVVLPAVSVRSTLPTLSNFLLEAADKKVKVYATDLEIGIESSLETEVEKEGSCTVPAKSLNNMIRVIDSEEFTLQKITTGEYEINAEDGNTTFKIHAGEKDDYPILPEIKEEKSTSIKASDLKEGIEKVIFSVSRDESRYVLCGIYFESDKNEFRMVSTDGRRLSYFGHKTKGGDKFNAIIPTKAINVLDKAITDDDEEVKISISTSENQIYFSFGNTIIYSRLIEGDYPNYTQVIPEKPTKNIKTDTESILNATRKMLAVTNERSMPVKYKFKDGKAVISVNAPETGSGTSTIPVEYKGEEIEIAFNAEFMINTLKIIKSETINFGLTTPINPGKITPVSDNENYVGVIMPMRP